MIYAVHFHDKSDAAVVFPQEKAVIIQIPHVDLDQIHDPKDTYPAVHGVCKQAQIIAVILTLIDTRKNATLLLIGHDGVQILSLIHI